MKRKIITLICVLMIMMTVAGGNKISATENLKGVYEFGKMYLDGLGFPEGTVLFSDSGEAYFSLDDFFRGLGCELLYDENSEMIYIYYLNDVLFFEKEYVKGVSNLYRMGRIVNGANIDTVFYNGGVLNKCYFQLSSMTSEGGYRLINDRIYLSSGSFGYLVQNLGFFAKIDTNSRIVDLFTATINKKMQYGGGGVYIRDERFHLNCFANGTFGDMFTWEETIKGEVEKKRVWGLIVDDNGRVYKRTYQEMPVINSVVPDRNAKFHDVESKTGEWNEGTAYFYNLKFPKGTVYYDTPRGTMISLRGFFEGIGSEVVYDENTKDVRINHINQELLWQKEVVHNTFTMRRSVNPSNVKTDSKQGYFKLNEKYDEGRYARIDGTTYIELDSFKRMASYLGYTVENNEETRELRISPVTLINWSSISDKTQFLNVVNGKRYLLSPLSDGSWIGHRENDKKDVIYVDGEGTIYELTDEVTDGSILDKKRKQ